MNCKIETCKYLPCATSVFNINGIPANTGDFGETFSKGDGNYGCLYNIFIPSKTPSKEILKKYEITEKEFFEIGDILEDRLKVGRCNYCL